MKAFCENQYCHNPGDKVVPVSVRKPSDQKRTLCTVCEEAYSWGVQHGTFLAREEGTDLHVNDRELATILAALRFHQDENLQGGREIPDQFIREIATNSGLFKPLSFQEVSDLCERLNSGEKPSGPIHPAVQRIHDLLYLDAKDGQESYDPDKSWDADTVTMVAEIIAQYIPRPKEGGEAPITKGPLCPRDP